MYGGSRYGGGYGGMGGGYGGMGGMGGMGMGMGMGGGMYGRGMYGGMGGMGMGMGGQNGGNMQFFEKAQMYIYQLCEIAQMVEFNAHGLAGFFNVLKNVSLAAFVFGKEWS